MKKSIYYQKLINTLTFLEDDDDKRTLISDLMSELSDELKDNIDNATGFFVDEFGERIAKQFDYDEDDAKELKDKIADRYEPIVEKFLDELKNEILSMNFNKGKEKDE